MARKTQTATASLDALRDRAADAARAVRDAEAAMRAAADKQAATRREITEAFAANDAEQADRLRADLRALEDEGHAERTAGARLAADRARREVSAFAAEHLGELFAERAAVAEKVGVDLAHALAAVVTGVTAWNAAAQEATNLLQLAGRAAELRVASLPFAIEQIAREVRRGAGEPIPAPMPAASPSGTLTDLRGSEPVLIVDDPAGEPVVVLPDLRGGG